MRPASRSFFPNPNPNPNPDASPSSPPPPPMTPRAQQLRHPPPHLFIADVVASWHPFHKKPCLCDRSTAPPSAHLADAAAAEAPTPPLSASGGGSFRWLGPRKRRRRGGGSRSVSGRSSDRRRSGTCSDFHVTCGPGGGGATDSSGEMWASDVGEVRLRDIPMGMVPEFGPAPVGGAGSGSGVTGAAVEVAAADSGYGSEPGYRGDVELGYGDEIDEEEEDGRQQLFFWGEEIGGCIADMNKMGIVGDNNFGEQKSHHRCRRKKHDVRMLDP
ncbi:hypothetical protein GUJ93_ZPchr0008g14077 [Zizania palustris]|uniref:Uncharacterized protein n=1 Tax=Zizania palustris TaxID=103762 RepID=A0A8J5R4B0_ZIZPA|nr:hypothetical protein GUJ93_ZPchr0008g14077 [Zizania palustris]